MEKKQDLSRFKKAQEFDYDLALKEIRNGRKENHYMWYIFPQLKGLGFSEISLYYGIENLEEAKAYMEDPLLSSHLREISKALLDLESNDPLSILGYPDHLKLQSSMTLFSYATDDNDVFLAVLDKFYNGKEDEKTLELLGMK